MSAIGATTLRAASGRAADRSDPSRPASTATSPTWVRPHWRGLWPVWLLSAAIHAGLVVAWLNRPTPLVAPAVPRLSVRIVPLPPLASTPVEPAPAARLLQDRPTTEPGTVRQPSARPAPPVAITPRADPTRSASPPSSHSSPVPAVTAANTDTSPTLTSDSNDAPAPTTPKPSTPTDSNLRLDWTPAPKPTPRGDVSSVRNQALIDARSNTHRPSAEARMAQAVGDDRLQEETLGDGRRRLRKGATCVDVHRTHIAQLNPFDSRLRDLNVAKSCD